MPHPLRIEYENAWHHVMNRGTNRQAIFNTKEEHQMFLELLAEISHKFYIEIHGYCLMTNHYHLLINTPLPNLGKAMRHLNGVYTKRFNQMENRDGPLFRGRYKSILIEAEDYLLQVSRYIHLNPVSAHICKKPEDYEWSSYRHYVGLTKPNDWLKKDWILDTIGEGSANPCERYASFVNQGIDPATDQFYNTIPVRAVFGTQFFIDNQLSKLTDKQKIFSNPDIARLTKVPHIQKIIEVVSNYFQCEPKLITNAKKSKKNIARIITIYLARQLAQLSYHQITEIFSLSFNSIGTLLKRYDLLINSSEKLSVTIIKLNTLILSSGNT
jgi:REP element-mobilizing transposase RayT